MGWNWNWEGTGAGKTRFDSTRVARSLALVTYGNLINKSQAALTEATQTVAESRDQTREGSFKSGGFWGLPYQIAWREIFLLFFRGFLGVSQKADRVRAAKQIFFTLYV